MARQAPKSLRWRLFERDGWLADGFYPQDHVLAGKQIRLAYCAFEGCTTLLTYENATVDHYPLPWRLGGTWHINNTRLACVSCNSGEKIDIGKYTAKMPIGLTPSQKKRWWLQCVVDNNIESELAIIEAARAKVKVPPLPNPSRPRKTLEPHLTHRIQLINGYRFNSDGIPLDKI
jgi:hypothetical protein